MYFQFRRRHIRSSNNDLRSSAIRSGLEGSNLCGGSSGCKVGSTPSRPPGGHVRRCHTLFLLLVPVFATAQTAVTTHNTNLRRDPSTNNAPIRLISEHDTISLLS